MTADDVVSAVTAVVAALRPDSTPEHLLEFVVAGGGMLAATVRYATPDTRAYHPSGAKVDPAGFAAMGCVETLVHGYDIASGLGVRLRPPAEVCARTVARRAALASVGCSVSRL